MSKIQLVQGDTAPALTFSITDDTTGLPVDLSAAGTVVRFKFRQLGATALKETLTATKLTGRLLADGTIDTSGSYAAAGGGGRVQVAWTGTSLDTAGDFEAELEVTFASGAIQTVLSRLQLYVRAQL